MKLKGHESKINKLQYTVSILTNKYTHPTYLTHARTYVGVQHPMCTINFYSGIHAVFSNGYSVGIIKYGGGGVESKSRSNVTSNKLVRGRK